MTHKHTTWIKRCSPGVRSLLPTMRGFTLVELMITLVIMSILIAVAAPSFNDVTLGNKLTSYANNFTASTVFARGEAIKRNTTVTMCASNDGTNCATSGGWEQGWIVKVGTTPLQRQQGMSSGIKITEADDKLTLDFRSTGAGATAATLTICRALPKVAPQQRIVRVSTTGRTSVTKEESTTCP